MTFGDLEAMFKTQATSKEKCSNEINEMLYSSFIGMKTVVERIAKRIDANAKLEEIPAKGYLDFVDALKTENKDIFKESAGGQDFLKALSKGRNTS